MKLSEGTKVVKCNSEAGDGHQDGATGKVVAAVEIPEPALKKILKDERLRKKIPEGHQVKFAYMVEFDDMPGVPIGVMDYRVEPA